MADSLRAGRRHENVPRFQLPVGDRPSSEPFLDGCEELQDGMRRTVNDRAQRRDRRPEADIFLEVQPIFRLILCPDKCHAQTFIDDAPGVAIAGVINVVHVCLSACRVQNARQIDSTLISQSYGSCRVSRHRDDPCPAIVRIPIRTVSRVNTADQPLRLPLPEQSDRFVEECRVSRTGATGALHLIARRLCGRTRNARAHVGFIAVEPVEAGRELLLAQP